MLSPKYNLKLRVLPAFKYFKGLLQHRKLFITVCMNGYTIRIPAVYQVSILLHLVAFRFQIYYGGAITFSLILKQLFIQCLNRFLSIFLNLFPDSRFCF